MKALYNPRSRHQEASLDDQVLMTCEATIKTVQESIRTVQSAALDLRDAIAALRRLHERVKAEASRPGAEQALGSALVQGVALLRSLEAIGIYEPVPIEVFGGARADT